jgi:hypothetical protein
MHEHLGMSMSWSGWPQNAKWHSAILQLKTHVHLSLLGYLAVRLGYPLRIEKLFEGRLDLFRSRDEAFEQCLDCSCKRRFWTANTDHMDRPYHI